MIKKILCVSTMASLVYIGCSDKSSEPIIDYECSFQKVSENTTVMTMIESGVTLTTTTTLKGNKAEIKYYALYDQSTPVDFVKQQCEDNKREAMTKNASVTCDDHSITIVETEDSYINMDQLVASQKEFCTYIPENTSQNTSYTVNKKATCQITEKSDSVITIVAILPDSASITMTTSYQDGIYASITLFDFEPTMPQKTINEACENMHSEKNDKEDIVCEERKITVTTKESYRYNPISVISQDVIQYCNEIQSTGIIPNE